MLDQKNWVLRKVDQCYQQDLPKTFIEGGQQPHPPLFPRPYAVIAVIFILVVARSAYNSFKMSLFVGNISKRVTVPQFEQTFRNFGRCRVDLRVCHPTS